MFKNLIKRSSVFLMILIILVCSVNLLYAADPNLGINAPDAISRALCNIVQLIQSDITKGIATIAVIFMAFGLFSGKVTWTVAIMTVIAIGSVVGADKIVGIMIGDNVTCVTIRSNI